MSGTRLAVAFLSLAVLAALAAGGAYLWFMGAVTAPGPLRAPVTVIVSPGSGLGPIARQLTTAGVISSEWLFEVEARRSKRAGSLKPGEYRFEAGTSVAAALDKIVRHDVVARFVTFPEGLVTDEMLQVLRQAEGLTGEITTVVGEGELLPETYRYEWGDTRESVIARMRSARDQALNTLWANRVSNLPLATPAEAVILASIVEKETGIAAERPRVAAVFINRLRLGMKLQSDPTTIYGLAADDGDLGRPLTRADLESQTLFNTYVIPGLPPSPICHPGKDALAAVLNPAETNELYFVADGAGGHAFATTLEGHNQNVARWRRLQQQNAKP